MGDVGLRRAGMVQEQAVVVDVDVIARGVGPEWERPGAQVVDDSFAVVDSHAANSGALSGEPGTHGDAVVGARGGCVGVAGDHEGAAGGIGAVEDPAGQGVVAGGPFRFPGDLGCGGPGVEGQPADGRLPVGEVANEGEVTGGEAAVAEPEQVVLVQDAGAAVGVDGGGELFWPFEGEGMNVEQFDQGPPPEGRPARSARACAEYRGVEFRVPRWSADPLREPSRAHRIAPEAHSAAVGRAGRRNTGLKGGDE